jgi:hypothetical protein
MRTFRFHVKCPEGKIFDTTGETAPYPPPESAGWVDTPAKLVLDKKKAVDQMIENAVKAELAAQGSDRDKLDAEHRKKYGEDPHTLATTAEVSNVMDNKTADGEGKIKPPKKSKTFTRPWER